MTCRHCRMRRGKARVQLACPELSGLGAKVCVGLGNTTHIICPLGTTTTRDECRMRVHGSPANVYRLAARNPCTTHMLGHQLQQPVYRAVHGWTDSTLSPPPHTLTHHTVRTHSLTPYPLPALSCARARAGGSANWMRLCARSRATTDETTEQAKVPRISADVTANPTSRTWRLHRQAALSSCIHPPVARRL